MEKWGIGYEELKETAMENLYRRRTAFCQRKNSSLTASISIEGRQRKWKFYEKRSEKTLER